MSFYLIGEKRWIDLKRARRYRLSTPGPYLPAVTVTHYDDDYELTLDILPDSPNTAWRNVSFRGYADYMSSTEFEHGLTQLLKAASCAPTAMMCAEAVWWRCHRSMIADALCARGIEVMHILDAKHSMVHPMTAPARIVRGELTYATAQSG